MSTADVFDGIALDVVGFWRRYGDGILDGNRLRGMLADAARGRLRGEARILLSCLDEGIPQRMLSEGLRWEDPHALAARLSEKYLYQEDAAHCAVLCWRTILAGTHAFAPDIPQGGMDRGGGVTPRRAPFRPNAGPGAGPAAGASPAPPGGRGRRAGGGSPAGIPSGGLTDEQRAAAESAGTARLTVTEALAGTGKTHAALAAMRACPGDSVLYLAFNNRIVREVEARLLADPETADRLHAPSGPNSRRAPDMARRIEPRTFHSLAFAHRTRARLGTLRPDNLAAMDGMDALLRPTDREGLRLWESAEAAGRLFRARTRSLVLRTHRRWLESDAASIREFFDSGGRFAAGGELRNVRMDMDRLFGAVSRLDAALAAGDRSLPQPHDFYLKRMQLALLAGERPGNPPDLVVVDEAQDMNGARISVVRSLMEQGARLLVIGDPHQQIYAWNGSVNAMTRFASMPGAAILRLTRSFRCPDTSLALRYLRLLGYGGRFDPADASPRKGDGRVAHLFRGNMGVLAAVARHLWERNDDPHGLQLLGGGAAYDTTMMKDMLLWQAGRADEMTDRELAAVPGRDEMERMIEVREDGALTLAFNLVLKFPSGRLWRMVKLLERNAFSDPAPLIYGTAHRAKGVEFGRVVIGDDFRSPADWLADTREPRQKEEDRINYVALTRFLDTLDPGPLRIDDEVVRRFQAAVRAGAPYVEQG